MYITSCLTLIPTSFSSILLTLEIDPRGLFLANFSNKSWTKRLICYHMEYRATID